MPSKSNTQRGPASPPAPPKPKPVPPPEKPQVQAVAPTAQPAHARPRHILVLLSFLIFVLAPAGGAGWYLWTQAADQYVSKVGFSVRREEANSAIEVLSGLSSLSGSSSTDTDILYEFVQSQKLVSDMDAALDLRSLWSKPEEDIVFSLDPTTPIEGLVNYWNRMVRLSFGAQGLLEVEVRAFDPNDATRIAEMLFAKSSEMINDLSAIAREDAIRYARADLDEALERLKNAREVITRFRNENQLVNPELDLQSQAGLLGNLHAQQAEAIIDIELMRETVRTGDPRMEQAERRLAVIESRIAAERRKLGIGGGTEPGGRAFADLIGEYERLVVDREFAERAYVTALAGYDGAQADSRRQSRYLAAYMAPTLAESPEHPKRITLLFLTTLFLFLSWSIVVLVAYSIKDRR